MQKGHVSTTPLHCVVNFDGNEIAKPNPVLQHAKKSLHEERCDYTNELLSSSYTITAV